MLVSGNVQSWFLFSVFGEVCESLCQGRGELNALLVHPALNVFSHSLDYALKRLSCNRTMEQSNKTVFFLFCLGDVCCCYSGGEIMFLQQGKFYQYLFQTGSILETQCIIPFSVVHYIVLTSYLYSTTQYESYEIPDWLILLNQNELSYATELFAAH